MNITYDLYAETNPAFISFLIYRFVKAYSDKANYGPHISLVYLAIPIAVSEKLEPSFANTSSSTGFLAWLNRFPEIRMGLQEDITLSKNITEQGLHAALHSKLLRINSSGTISMGTATKPPENTKSKLADVPKRAVVRSETLGKWMSGAGRPSSIFSALEINL